PRECACWRPRQNVKPDGDCKKHRKPNGNGSKRSCLLAMSAEMPELPEHLFGALQELAAVLEQFGVRYALIGGMASAFTGPPRETSTCHSGGFTEEVNRFSLTRSLECRQVSPG